ncbi:hypothetical protein INT47_006567 [Mucor saturninus]|uniref:Uncharacterized protein n=1 Tax=Mucor saturninus TaxID=64648 RepID=A0A8H7V2K0_9FUNG|nr:hypothetical protein INT47_006567 [Mucor saturninus]
MENNDSFTEGQLLQAQTLKDFVPDLRNLGRHQDGFATELGSSDADKIKQAIEAAQRKPVTLEKKRSVNRPVVHTIAGYRVSHPLRDDARIGWTAFSDAINPGGSLHIAATEKKKSDEFVLWHENWQDYGVIFIVGVGFWVMAKWNGSMGILVCCLLFVGSYYKLSLSRLSVNATDDIKREFAHIALESSDFERVEWLNNFVGKFWLIFEPVLSAYVIDNIDTYLVDYLPGFLDSVRLTTFTLGSKAFRVDSVKSFTNVGPDTVCMDWSVSFTPNDPYGMTQDQLDSQVSPKVVLNIRLGKGFVGTAFPVLVEDMSFQGRMRVKIQFMSKMPHVKIIEACFMEKPKFDYVLKPLGGETFGFDVNNIPGLQSFVRDQAHAILGPMLYYPNVFSFDMEKFFSGEMDINQANGVLAITVHSCTQIKSSDTNLNTFIRFYLDEAQELEKTAICENSHTPHWNETRFILLNNLNSILTMELRTTNHTKKSGKRLARAHFDLKDMKYDDDMELDDLELPMQRHGKFITNLLADMKYFPVSKPIKNEDGTVIEAAPSNSGVLRVTIHECKNLGPNNKMNPFATIKINGIDRFETPTFKRTPNPKFERSFEILVLDRTEVFLRVGVTDRINFAGDASLGAWDGYLVDIMRDQEENEYWWTLKKKGQNTSARLKLSVQWKPVVMDGLAKMGGVGIYTPPIGVIRFSIWSAVGLVGSNKQDPYVRIKSSRQQIRAKTEVLDNTDCPEWGEYHYVPVHSMHEDLVLEVMDWSSGSKDKSLGSTMLHLKDVVLQKKDGDTVWYEAAVPKWDVSAPLSTGNIQKGHLKYSAEFYPTMALPESEVKPLYDLHHVPIRYTPDDLVDLSSYSTGVLTVKIHEIKASQVYDCYCQLMVDSLSAQHKTNQVKGRILAINETSDAFIKDAGFSRVAIEVKPVKTTDKDDERLAYWYESSERIIRKIQKRAREMNGQEEEGEDEGEWYNLINPVGGSAKIRLSFSYVPLLNYKVNPDESLENQGNLTVTLLNAKHLKPVDKSGTSDPFVKFVINGELVHKSGVIKKSLNPVWKDEKFDVPIMSRVTASFRIEVFDWNKITGDVPLGSGGLTLRGDMVESFMAQECDIPLDGVEGVMGSTVRVRLKWEPQLLQHRRTHTTFMGTTRKMTTKMGTTAFNWSLPPKDTSSSPSSVSGENNKFSVRSIQSKVSDIASSVRSTEPPKQDLPAKGVLTVRIIEARGLPGQADKLHPQVSVHLGNQHVLKTRKLKKTASPSWDESFSHEVMSGQEIELEIRVKDAHTFHSTDLGLWTSSLWDLIRPPLVNSLDKWLPLEPEGSGEIHVKLDYQ